MVFVVVRSLLSVVRFTRMHYRIIAETLRARYNMYKIAGSQPVFWEVVEDLCIMFKADNPRFDREKFIMWVTQ